ncbi:MAG: hypothetical protein AB3X44_16295 [Leptothrix sp. (in: b-proteobacteria)]
MASINEQITARLAALLTGTTAAGVNVYRSREIPVTRQVSPAIVVRPDADSVERFAQNVNLHRFAVLVEVFTRGDPADTLAEPIDTAAAKLITTDATLLGLVASVFAGVPAWESDEADRTAGCLTRTYEFVYLANARDPASPPNS